MTDSDRTVRVLCSFDAIDQTVTLMSPNSDKPGIDVHKKSYLYSGTSDYSGSEVGNPSTGLTSSARSAPITSVVTNTAPPPSVIMRILDRTGKDAQIVGLGDELTLQIELRDASSAFGLFARNLYARSSNGESLFLLDNSGCPTDALIFPALQLDPKGTRALNAVFKAFRFPSSGIVNFEVQVRFCQDKCEPVKCSSSGSTSGGDSFGRRKRRSASSLTQLLDLKAVNEDLDETSESAPEEINFDDMSSTTTETSVTDYSTKLSDLSDEESLNVSKSPLMEETPSAVKFVMNDTASGVAVTPTSQHQVQPHQSRSIDPYQHGLQGHHNPYSYPQDYMSSASSPYPPSSSTGNNYYPANHGSFGNFNPYLHQPSFMNSNAYSPGMPSHHLSPSASNINPWVHSFNSNNNNPFIPHTGSFTPSSHFNHNDSGNRMNPNEPLSKFSYSPSSQETSSTTTPSSRNMFVHSSRPLPSTEKGKFRPPRPLARPKGSPSTTSGSSVVGTDTLRTTIMVGEGPDKEVNENADSIDRSWSPSIRSNCNTGPAILYTAIIVTLLHIGIVLGGYLYYRRFGYTSSRVKLFSTPSFSRENIVRESFGGPSFSSLSSNNHLTSHHHSQQLLSSPLDEAVHPKGHHILRPTQKPPPVPAKPTMASVEAGKRFSNNCAVNINDNPNVVSSSSAHNSNVFYGTASNRHQHHLQVQDRMIMQQHHHLRDNSPANERGRAFTSFYAGVYGSGDP